MICFFGLFPFVLFTLVVTHSIIISFVVLLRRVGKSPRIFVITFNICLIFHGIIIYFVVLCRRVGKPPRIIFIMICFALLYFVGLTLLGNY